MWSHLSILLASDSSGKKRKASDEIPVINDIELESIWKEAMEKTIEEELAMAAMIELELSIIVGQVSTSPVDV